MQLEMLSKEWYEEVFMFEQKNKEFFESMLPARPDGYENREIFVSMMDRLLEEQANHRGYFYLIVENGTVIGRMNYFNIRGQESMHAEVGYRIDKDYIGMGIGKKMLGVLLERGETIHGFSSIEAGCNKDNNASIALLKSTGFHAIGCRYKDICINDKWVDTLLFVKEKDELG